MPFPTPGCAGSASAATPFPSSRALRVASSPPSAAQPRQMPFGAQTFAPSLRKALNGASVQ
eukprot:12494521-Alexandrium_andersonii.AAC.1